MKRTNNIQKSVRNSKVVRTEKKTTTPATTYQAVDRNIYFDGYSYRARITVNGTCNSQNFHTKLAAVRWRNAFLRSL